VRLSDLSERLGLNRTTLFHLLATLQAHGWVARDPARRYALGARFLDVSSRYLRQLLAFDIGALARPYMEALWRALNETVHLSVLDRSNRVVIDVDSIESTRELRTAGGIGQPKPLYCTASGKVFLAYMPDDERESHLAAAALTPRTGRTITDPDRLRRELGAVRERGYALDDREYDPDIFCMAAPVFKAPDQPGAALMISFPANRLQVRAVEEVSAQLRDVAAQVSLALAARLERASRLP
ncbi:MAG: IclR family transcriptional regulator, partial [Bacillota bacterium]